MEIEGTRRTAIWRSTSSIFEAPGNVTLDLHGGSFFSLSVGDWNHMALSALRSATVKWQVMVSHTAMYLNSQRIMFRLLSNAWHRPHTIDVGMLSKSLCCIVHLQNHVTQPLAVRWKQINRMHCILNAKGKGHSSPWGIATHLHTIRLSCNDGESLANINCLESQN